MKKITLVLIVSALLFTKQGQAQNNGAGIVAAAAGIAAIGAGIAAIEDMKERAELTGTQWILANHPELTSFSLKTLDFDGKKLKDMSNTTLLYFKVQEFTPSDNPQLDGKRQILFAFTSYGWINDYGIDFSKVRWYLIDGDEWMKMMVAYAKVSSPIKDETILKTKISSGKVVNRGVKVNGNMEVPFFKLEGDMYLVSDYSDEMKLVYNERTLGIFLKKTRDLVQMRRSSIIEIHEFLFDQNKVVH
jgi:hypothetical protein